MFEVSFSQASRKDEFFSWRRLNSFFFLVSALLRLFQWFVWALYRVRFVLSFCLFVFSLMGKAEWGDNSVCWWLGLYFYFVCCLDEASCTGCYWWLGDARSCIQVVSFLLVLTIWYSRLSDFTFTFHFHALEKEIATHSSVLTWRIPGMREPDGLPSVGSHRVGHNWSDLAVVAVGLVLR